MLLCFFILGEVIALFSDVLYRHFSIYFIVCNAAVRVVISNEG